MLVALGHAPDRVPLATHIRGSVLSSSFQTVEVSGRRDAYFAALSPAHHGAMRSIVVSEWLAMELAMAHYGALESLALTEEEARKNGRRVAERVQKSYLGTLAKVAGTGITPWAVLPRMQTVLDRLMLGSSVAIWELGPKDAHIEIHGVEIARFAYVRAGWAGMIEGGFDLVTRKTFCRDVSPQHTATVASYIVTWA